MPSPTPRQLARLAGLFGVLGDPARLRILQALRAEPRSVGDIHRACRLKQANTSKHLRVLREARIVAAQRAGTSVLYRISEPLVIELCDLVCGTDGPAREGFQSSARLPRRAREER